MKHNSQTVRDWLGYLRQAELEGLRDLAASLQPGSVVVNIGAGGGTSGLVFMEAPTKLKVFTVDRQASASPLGCLAGERAVFESAGFWGDPRHSQIHGDSTDIGRNWTKGPIDLIFHDADHTYDKVKVDIEAWRPHLKPGGIFAFHDYDDERHVGVKPAADEMLADCDRFFLVERLAAFRLPELIPA